MLPQEFSAATTSIVPLDAAVPVVPAPSDVDPELQAITSSPHATPAAQRLGVSRGCVVPIRRLDDLSQIDSRSRSSTLFESSSHYKQHGNDSHSFPDQVACRLWAATSTRRRRRGSGRATSAIRQTGEPSSPCPRPPIDP